MGNVSRKREVETDTWAGKESIVPLPGTIVAEYKRCGKPRCRCATGALHGPYTYRYYREGGRLRKRYIRPGDLASIRGGIEVRKRVQAERRVVRWQIRTMIAQLKQAGLW